MLVSGASIAGLSTAYCMNKLGYRVTIVELANEPRVSGAAIDLRESAIGFIKNMGIYEQLKSHGLQVEQVEFKNADDSTAGSIKMGSEEDGHPNNDIEIERDKFIRILYDALKDDVEFIFNDSIIALNETTDNIEVTFKNSPKQAFELVFGCDGLHSGVRKIWFGEEAEYAHFLEAYFSITIVNKLLVAQKTMQMYNEPDKAVMINAYNNKTDIIFCFFSEKEFPYNYKDIDHQRKIITDQFTGQGWRTAELLKEAEQASNFYFDKFCQIKMPSWTKGRVALVGDAGYCASPAAGMGGSLSVIGAGALAELLEKHNWDYTRAFQDYNKNLRPFIDEVQAKAKLNIKENFIPRTEEAIRQRNEHANSF